MTNETGNVGQRLVVLEEKLEYQDYTLEKLNEVLITQQNQIDKLELEVQRLREKLEVQALDMESKEKEAPPPHF